MLPVGATKYSNIPKVFIYADLFMLRCAPYLDFIMSLGNSYGVLPET